MRAAKKVGLSADDFCRGVVLGLRAIGVIEIKLLNEAGHYAARYALTYLERNAKGQFDYRFLIILNEIYGDSDDWSDAVTTIWGSGLLRLWGGGNYEIKVGKDSLDQYFRLQPGSRALWEGCARRFLEAHQGFPPQR